MTSNKQHIKNNVPTCQWCSSKAVHLQQWEHKMIYNAVKQKSHIVFFFICRNVQIWDKMTKEVFTAVKTRVTIVRKLIFLSKLNIPV